MLWGPGHRLVEHPDFAQLAGETGLVDYWEQSHYGAYCKPDGAALQCGQATESLPREPLRKLLKAIE